MGNNARGFDDSVGMNAADGFSFASGVLGASAGELQTPLALIRQLSLALHDSTLSEGERQRLTERLTLTSERALRITQSLRIDARMANSLKLEPVNAAMLCSEVVHELTPLFRAHGRALVAQPRNKLLLMVADRTLLRQVLFGFVDNALHYGSDDRPVQLTIGGHAGKVRVGVRDYGPAVAIDALRRLDERIARQAPVLIARRPRASGVGLAMAKQAAQMMGGAAGVVRHRDGATFYIDMNMSGQMSLL